MASTTTVPEIPSPPPPNPSDESQGVTAQQAEFTQLAPPTVADGGPTLDFIHDVPITISVRLGQVVLPIGEILKLGPGAVLELDRDINQPVDLTVRGMVFARGEVVVVDDHFAVRIKELLPPKGSKSPIRKEGSG